MGFYRPPILYALDTAMRLGNPDCSPSESMAETQPKLQPAMLTKHARDETVLARVRACARDTLSLAVDATGRMLWADHGAPAWERERTLRIESASLPPLCTSADIDEFQCVCYAEVLSFHIGFE
jgi:hypothetical protein